MGPQSEIFSIRVDYWSYLYHPFCASHRPFYYAYYHLTLLCTLARTLRASLPRARLGRYRLEKVEPVGYGRVKWILDFASVTRPGLRLYLARLAPVRLCHCTSFSSGSLSSGCVLLNSSGTVLDIRSIRRPGHISERLASSFTPLSCGLTPRWKVGTFGQDGRGDVDGARQGAQRGECGREDRGGYRKLYF